MSSVRIVIWLFFVSPPVLLTHSNCEIDFKMHVNKLSEEA